MARKKVAARKTAARKSKRVDFVPKGYRIVTPAFVGPECARALEFLQKVFGAKVTDKYEGPDGTLMHAELRIGDSTLMCGIGMDGVKKTLSAQVYVRDCDAVFAKALAAGATAKEPPSDKFYGDRNGRVIDPFGNEWVIATHVEDVSQREMHKRAAAMHP